MLGLKAKVGKLEIPGLGIRLTIHSTQEQFMSAIKHAPSLKKGGHVIELTEKDIKDRAAMSNTKKTKK